MSNKVLGDKIKDILCWLMDNTVAKTHSSKIFKVIGCVDELIEKANKVDDLQTELVTTATDLSEVLDRVVGFENSLDYGASVTIGSDRAKIKSLEEENRMIQLQNDEITNFFQMKYVELKQLKQDALNGAAIKLLAQTDSEHDLFRYLQLDPIYLRFMLPDGDGAYDLKLIDWYHQKLEKEGSNA